MSLLTGCLLFSLSLDGQKLWTERYLKLQRGLSLLLLVSILSILANLCSLEI